jgi:hypothetical protein
VPFGEASWFKAGLLSALDALDQIGTRREALLEWSRAARRAVEGIDEHSAFTFQRAAIQDAARATVDVFLLASTLSPAEK